MQNALGLMECIGYTAAMAAADAALKAADVRFLGHETIIGVRQKASVAVKIEGEVAAVHAAVQAGETAAAKIGEVVSVHVIPRPHEQTDKIIFWPKAAEPENSKITVLRTE